MGIAPRGGSLPLNGWIRVFCVWAAAVVALACSAVRAQTTAASVQALSFDGDAPPGEEWVNAHFGFGAMKGAAPGAGVGRYLEDGGKATFVIPASGYVATLAKYDGGKTPYRVSLRLSWGTGDGICIGIAGKWVTVSRDGLEFRGGWKATAPDGLPVGSKFDIRFDVSADRIGVWALGKQVGVYDVDKPRNSPVVLRGWREGWSCHGLRVAPPNVPAGPKDPAAEVEQLAAGSLRASPDAGMSPELASGRQASEKDWASSVLIVAGEGGTGTGFVTELFGRTFVVSNAHVVLGEEDVTKVKLTDHRNRSVPFSEVYFARENDVVLFRAECADLLCLPLEPAFGTVVTPGERVSVLGNSQGMKTITRVQGKVLSVGPDRVEVDAGYVQGNSGSPIILSKTGTVIGVATFAVNSPKDWLAQGTRFSGVRRFGERLDTLAPNDLQKLVPRRFGQDCAALNQAAKSLELTVLLIRDLLSTPALVESAYTNAAMRRIVREWNKELAAGTTGARREQRRSRTTALLKDFREHLGVPFETGERHAFAYDLLQATFGDMKEAHRSLNKQLKIVGGAVIQGL